jgi:membrane-bound serine protease (ClpP class)
MNLDLLLLSVPLLIFALFIAALSRHKKSATIAVNIIGATGLVESALAPEGAVIIKGELWRARVEHGGLETAQRVRVVGVEGHLVLVEPMSDEL